MKKCNHKETFYIEKTFREFGFLKSVSFNICSNCGQMSDLEENFIKDKKREVKLVS